MRIGAFFHLSLIAIPLEAEAVKSLFRAVVPFGYGFIEPWSRPRVVDIVKWKNEFREVCGMYWPSALDHAM
jgi:hypothetical protein